MGLTFENRTAVVTGAGRGIGKAIAETLAGHGVEVVCVSRTPETCTAVAEGIVESGGRARPLPLDVGDGAAVQAASEKLLSDYGGIDILVNNAGINIRKLPQDYDASDWDQVLAGNLRSAFLCSKSVYPSMKAVGGGKIINIGSMASIFGGAKLAPYGASKGGIVQMSRSLACAWAEENIQVNAILPGWIDTELTQQARKDIPGLNETVIARTPTGRWGETHELAGAAIFLASPASDFVTGVALPVDGGYSSNLL